MTTFECYALSDAGRDPDGNEDAFVLDERANVFVIADGVGGRPGGARASRVTADTFVERMRSVPPEQRLDEATLRSAVTLANDSVLREGETDERVRGLASTLAAVVAGDHHAKIVHVGDSRIYQLHAGALEQLTSDHTVAAEMEKEGVHGINRRFRSMLSRAIGSAETVRADVRDVPLASGDCLLLVTDGISKALSTEELRAMVDDADARTICGRILQAALAKGATDNLTVAVLRVR
jgi:protein phosphatase